MSPVAGGPALWVAAALTGLATWWALAPPRRPAGVRPRTATPVRGSRPGAWPVAAAVGCGLGAWAFVGGVAGIGAGVVVGLLVRRVLAGVEPPAVARRREQVTRDLPTAVDLLAACLDAGEAPAAAMRTVAQALHGPVAEELEALRHRLDLGVDPTVVWGELASHPQLGPVGRALARAHESGASVRDAVHRLAVELRERDRAEAEERARALEVKVAAPLGLCLLPAFVVLGIVPLVVGLVTTLAPR